VVVTTQVFQQEGARMVVEAVVIPGEVTSLMELEQRGLVFARHNYLRTKVQFEQKGLDRLVSWRCLQGYVAFHSLF